MGGGGSTTVTEPAPTAEELELTKQQIELSKQQLALIEQQSNFQEFAFELVKPQLEREAKLFELGFTDPEDPVFQEILRREQGLQLEQLKQAEETLPLEKEILELQLEEIRRGGAASPEQKALIEEVTERNLQSGLVDIERFRTQGLESLRENLAPALGLRPTDTPILDRGGDIAAEALRQEGQLTSSLRGAAATAELNFPLAASQITSGINQNQQGLLTAKNEFLSNLRNAATQNRLRLTDALGGSAERFASSGIGLASAARPQFPRFGQRTSGSSSGASQAGSIIGGVGGLAVGAAAVF